MTLQPEHIKALRALSPEQQALALADVTPEDRKAFHASEPEPQISANNAEDEHTSEEELIETVKKWNQNNEEDPDDLFMSAEEMLEELREIIEARPPKSPVSEARLKEILMTYAPNAPKKRPERKVQSPEKKSEPKMQSGSMAKSKNFTYPVELEPLIKSGVAVVENEKTGPVSGHVLLHRCDKCGQFKTMCCGRVSWTTAVRSFDNTLTAHGRQAVGWDSIIPPEPEKTAEQVRLERKTNWHQESWFHQFSGFKELEGTGEVKMFIENFLPEGTTLICGLPKEGKSWLALSIAKALTSGKPLFGRLGFEVPEIIPVIYLAAESGDGALKLRLRKFNMTEDKTLFMARTLTKGPMFGLDATELEQAVKAMHPIVILETLIRFNEGKDEDDAAENRKLAQAIFRLIGWGARGVVGIHHSRKDLNKDKPTKEAAVRGSGDGLAMVDAVWLVMQDEKLYQGNTGPNEIDVVGWGRDFSPRAMRLALTEKTPDGFTGVEYAPGLVSLVDTTGDFGWVEKHTGENLKQLIDMLIQDNPAITRADLIKATGRPEWEVRKAIQALGYRRGKGGDTAKSVWTRDAVTQAVAAAVKTAKAA